MKRIMSLRITKKNVRKEINTMMNVKCVYQMLRIFIYSGIMIESPLFR